MCVNVEKGDKHFDGKAFMLFLLASKNKWIQGHEAIEFTTLPHFSNL